MHRKHLSPRSFFILLLSLPLIAVVLVSAAVFVYYPISITANWVDPPIRFRDPRTPGVSVTFPDHPDNTTAVIHVEIPRDLVLDDRNAYIWDDFNTNPFPARLTLRGTCIPGASWDSVNELVRFDATIRGTGGWYGNHMVAYYATEAPSGTRRVYFLMRTRVTSPLRGVWKGFFFFHGPPDDRRYYAYEFWDLAVGMTIARIGPPPPFRAVRLVTMPIMDRGGIWYGQWGVRDVSTGYMEYRTYGAPSTIRARDMVPTHMGTPYYVGFGGALSRGEIVEFDDFIASADADPLFVNVTNLRPGWTVYLEDSVGNVLTSATADPNGVASLGLSMATGWIIRNGRLRAMHGNVLIISKSFDVIVGGDVYRFVGGVLTDRNLLAYRNFDTKSYNVYMRLEDYSITGHVYSLNLWIRIGTDTTPIRIVNNVVITDTTSTISLGPGATDYIHGDAVVEPLSTVVLTLRFRYYLPASGVEVEYPVTMTIHG